MIVGIECIFGHLVKKPNAAAPFLKNFIAYLPSKSDTRYVLFTDPTFALYLADELKRPDIETVIVTQNRSKLDRIVAVQWSIPIAARKALVDVYCSIASNDLPYFGRFKKVIRVTSLAYIHHPEMFRSKALLFRKFSNWIIARKADKIVANSLSMRRDIANQYRIPPENVPMIYESVDPFWLESPATDRESELLADYRIRKPYFLFVSTITEYKNPQALLSAYMALRQRVPNLDFQLVFVGSGDLLEELKSRTIESKLESDIHFTGFVEKDDLFLLFNAADVVVHPSYYEATGNVLLQAMTLGKPLVASNVMSMPEMVDDAAILVDPDDSDSLSRALETVATNPQIKNDLARKSKRRSKKFEDWSGNLEDFLEVVRDVHLTGRKFE